MVLLAELAESKRSGVQGQWGGGGKSGRNGSARREADKDTADLHSAPSDDASGSDDALSASSVSPRGSEGGDPKSAWGSLWSSVGGFLSGSGGGKGGAAEGSSGGREGLGSAHAPPSQGAAGKKTHATVANLGQANGFHYDKAKGQWVMEDDKEEQSGANVGGAAAGKPKSPPGGGRHRRPPPTDSDVEGKWSEFHRQRRDGPLSRSAEGSLSAGQRGRRGEAATEQGHKQRRYGQRWAVEAVVGWLQRGVGVRGIFPRSTRLGLHALHMRTVVACRLGTTT